MRSSYVIAGALAIGVAAWIASGQVNGTTPEEETPQAEESAEAKPVTVRAREFKAETITRDLVLLGRTEASRTVRVKSEAASRVVAVGAEKGDRVKRGDLIVRLAMDDRQARLAQARANVEQRRLEYDAARKLADKKYRSRTNVAAAQALLEAAKADLERIRVDIGRTTIVAPFNGVLEDRTVEIGDFVDKGSPVAVLVDLDPVKLVVDVPEREIGRVAVGTVAGAETVDGQRVAGTVSYVASASSQATRTFRVEIEIANEQGLLRDGTTAKVLLPAGSARAHKLSPALLTLSDEGVIGVKAVNGEGVVRFLPVSLVSDSRDGMWLGGLPDRVELITAGQEYVRVGQKVRVARMTAEGNAR